MSKETTYKSLYEEMKQKYNSMLNKRDCILQSVYNDMMYGQPIKFSLRTELLRHCKERGLDIPEEIYLEDE